MDEENLEEEIDILECIYDKIDFAISMFKDLSSEDCNTIVSQMQELLNDIDHILIEKQEKLDEYDKQQLAEARLERYEREIEYRKSQGF